MQNNEKTNQLEEQRILTGDEMDWERRERQAYEYLCHLEEARQWLESVVGRYEGTLGEWEQEMKKGIILASVMAVFSPQSVKKIFREGVLQYRHTDNINYFLDGLSTLGLPKIFYFEVLDLYESKNVPKVIYCIHAFAHFLYKTGRSRNITTLVGEITFTSDQIVEKSEEIKASGISMPQFSKVSGVLSENLKEDVIFKLKAAIRQKLARKKEEEARYNMEKLKEILLKEGEEIKNTRVQRMSDIIIPLARKYVNGKNSQLIQRKLKAFLWEKAFKEIYYRKNVSLFSIKLFLFIFFEKSKEVKKEKEIEELHDQIIEKIKDNYFLEMFIEEIEMRISILTNNRANINNVALSRPTMDDVISTFPPETKEYKAFQNIFYHLQSNPKYLIQILLNHKNPKEFILNYIIPLFSYGQTRREEYLLYRFVEMLLNEELMQVNSVDISKLLSFEIINHYFRLNCDSLREALLRFIKELTLETECNPTAIYYKIYKEEVAKDLALEKIQDVFLIRARNLKQGVSTLLQTIEKHIPYSIKFYLKNLYLQTKGTLIEDIRRIFYYEFIQPILIAPEAFTDIVEISQEERNRCNNINEFMEVLVSNDKFTNELEHLSVLEDYKNEEYINYCRIIDDILDVDDLNDYFQVTDSNEIVRVQRPVVYFSASEANTILKELKNISEKEDNIHDENLPDNKNILSTNENTLPDNINDDNTLVSSLEDFWSIVNTTGEIVYKDDSKIAFYLAIPEVVNEKDPLIQTKQKVVLLSKIANGRDLLDLLMRESTAEEQSRFESEGLELLNMVEEGDKMPSSIDDFKCDLLDEFRHLESSGSVTIARSYGEILDLLAQDLIYLKFMSAQRNKELAMNKATLENLETKNKFLKEKAEANKEYLRSFADKMIVKRKGALFFKGKENEIRRLGKDSVYGTYRYSAKSMKKKGVLLDIYNYPEDQYEGIYFYFSCSDPTVFMVEIYVLTVRVAEPYYIRLDDLIRKQSAGVKTYDVKGICLFDMNGLVKFINKKYIA
ncbi:Ras GTPase-activating-like protein IQGAP1 [Astathelohania contejeani]|uniref:Ras GTPase-activating-like protein IQGAP1 n=1 Tax=Astathelohania contejeani TaxID=164912 RepID=A0ABQ7HXH7_9MICR|nr:Ras GTPase-activating-like protein IQGAP1 [Thelohania contejeani]